MMSIRARSVGLSVVTVTKGNSIVSLVTSFVHQCPASVDFRPVNVLEDCYELDIIGTIWSVSELSISNVIY